MKQTSQSLHDVVHGGLRFVPQQGVDGHHHPWSAETTLGAVSLRYSLLKTQPDPTIRSIKSDVNIRWSQLLN